MEVSDRGIELIIKFEGLRLEAYQCQAGIWTIGYGHTKGVKENDKISKNEALEFLFYDIEEFEECVSSSVTVDLNQNEFDALLSLCFNIGISAFKKSTLLKRLNEGRRTSAALEILRWNKVNRVANKGLTTRRIAEYNLFLRGLK